MDDFPEFMKSAANRIARTSQATPGVEGYIFDGAGGVLLAVVYSETAGTSISPADNVF